MPALFTRISTVPKFGDDRFESLFDRVVIGDIAFTRSAALYAAMPLDRGCVFASAALSFERWEESDIRAAIGRSCHLALPIPRCGSRRQERLSL